MHTQAGSTAAQCSTCVRRCQQQHKYEQKAAVLALMQRTDDSLHNGGQQLGHALPRLGRHGQHLVRRQVK